jgi:hypothetical protein
MFIQSNPNTLSLFNPSCMEDKKNIVGWDDQIYVNQIKDRLTYKKLPLELFPNGRFYYSSNDRNRFSLFKKKLHPFLIHFNWVVGHEKQNKMKYFKKWFI